MDVGWGVGVGCRSMTRHGPIVMYFSGLNTQMHHSWEHLGILSPWDIVRLDIVLHGFLSLWGFVPLGLCPPGLLSHLDVVPLGFCPHGILSSWDFVRLDIVLWVFVQWDFVLEPIHIGKGRKNLIVLVEDALFMSHTNDNTIPLHAGVILYLGEVVVVAEF